MQFQATIRGEPVDVKVDVNEKYNYRLKSSAVEPTTKETRTAAHFVLNPGQPLYGTITQKTDVTYPNAYTNYRVTTIDRNTTTGEPVFGSYETDVYKYVDVPIYVTLGFDSYGYPASIESTTVASCTYPSGTPVNGDVATSPEACSLLQDGYSRTVENYNTTGELQPRSNDYNISNYTAEIANSTANRQKISIPGLTLSPGVGFVHASISVGNVYSAFWSNYTRTKVWANADNSNFYTLEIPMWDRLGFPAFNLTVRFRTETGSNGEIVKPPVTALEFPDLENRINSFITPPNKPVEMDLILEHNDMTWDYRYIIPY